MKYSPIRRISKKKGAMIRLYMKLRKEFLNENTLCHICAIRFSTDIHHSRGRSGSLLNERKYWLSTCRSCHEKCHKEPAWARQMGYSLDRLSYE